MNKEISKNDLYDVVLVGKGPDLQTLFKVIGGTDYNLSRIHGYPTKTI